MPASSKILLAINSWVRGWLSKESHTIIVTERANQTKFWPLPRYIYWVHFFVISTDAFLLTPHLPLLCHSIYIHGSRLDSRGWGVSKLSSSWRVLRKDEVVLRVRRRKTVLLECNPTPKQKSCLQWEGGTWSTSHRFVEFLFISLLRIYIYIYIK